MDPRVVCVVALGRMGGGIAFVGALSGLETRVCEADPELARSARAAMIASLARIGERRQHSADETRAIGDRLIAHTNLDEACAGVELVIEAIPESLEQKAALFARIVQAAPPAALLASNTSGLSISELGRRVGSAERFLGLHFFNPPTSMELLEIVVGEATSAESVERALAFARAVGKTPIVVRDSPGFATSRLGVVLGVEAMRMVEEGVASVVDIDCAMELGYRHPMGPLKVSDLVGLDVRLAILEHLAKELGPRFEPPALLRTLVAKGRLGKKVGVGFYRRTDAGPVAEPWE